MTTLEQRRALRLTASKEDYAHDYDRLRLDEVTPFLSGKIIHLINNHFIERPEDGSRYLPISIYHHVDVLRKCLALYGQQMFPLVESFDNPIDELEHLKPEGYHERYP